MLRSERLSDEGSIPSASTSWFPAPARIDSGAASVDIAIPDGVAARISGHMGVGTLSVNQSRFFRRGDAYESEGYANGENQLELTVEGGVGSVSVR